MALSSSSAELGTWIAQEAKAEQMIPLIGTLYRECSSFVSVFGRSIVNVSVIDIIRAHNASKYVLSQNPAASSNTSSVVSKKGNRRIDSSSARLDVFDTFPILEELVRARVRGARIDLGRLSLAYAAARDAGEQHARNSLRSFLQHHFLEAHEAALVAREATAPASAHPIVLYGFGRIGRLLARLLIEKTGGGEKLLLRAIVVRSVGDLAKRASLLRRDSVHGKFRGEIRVDYDAKHLIVNGNRIIFIEASDPTSIDYTEHGIENAILIDNTGVWRDAKGLGLHLKAKGIAKVLLTAPSKNATEVPNVVMGVNDAEVIPSPEVGATPDSVFANTPALLATGSCTTNAVSPLLLAVSQRWGAIRQVDLITVHAYTNDQNLVDNMHKKDRRGRAACANAVLTETGASKAVGEVIPELQGRVTAQAIRVPIPCVSLAMLAIQLEDMPEGLTVAQVNQHLQQVSLYGPLHRQIDYSSSSEVATSDFVGSRSAAVVDSESTRVLNNTIHIAAYYDNEFGFSAQVIRMVQRISGVELKHPKLPAESFPLFPTF
jgi:glyceraldehyde 3-phosphate dehydrogenase